MKVESLDVLKAQKKLSNKDLHLEQMGKLDDMIKQLDGVVLYPPLMWLWTWSEIDDLTRNNSDYELLVPREEIFLALVDECPEFSLVYGSEEHYDVVLEWLLEKGFIKDLEDEEEDIVEDTHG